MAMETLKKTVSDNSSIASRGNHDATGLELISRVLTSASPRDTIISESSKDATLKSSHNQETPTKAWKRPWPLLSPASPSLLSTRVGGLEGQGLQPSPAKGWPQRSPINVDREHDAASFALFTHSFDTLSEAENLLRPSPYRATDQPPRKIRVGHDETGDISPIKLESTGIPGNKDRRTSQARPINFEPASYPSDHGLPEEAVRYNAKGYSETASNPFFVLRTVSKAFDSFTYKLGCLRDGDICPIKLSRHASTINRYSKNAGISYRDIETARSRVETALCAFGGYHSISPRSGIFRSRKSEDQDYYEACLHQRYTIAGNHVSWELEDSPPVLVSDNPWSGRLDFPTARAPTVSVEKRGHPSSPGVSASSSVVPVDSQQKMRYRCKLCHQLKQNHVCPYRKSLQRSIGVTVQPSVNAFTAAEPGSLAPPLSEMNNFVPYSEDPSENPEEYSPDHTRGAITPRISPDSAQARWLHYSPDSSLSEDSRKRRMHPGAPRSVNKRPKLVQDKSLFVEPIDLKPEQFRIVTELKSKEDSTAFNYPAVPLPFLQRKRLSDTLFALARQLPHMADECASHLRRARANDEWDLAVAQLLCQLVVGLYCAEGDNILDGLKRYLLRMGIAC